VPLPALQSLLPQEIPALVSGVTIDEARKLISLAHRALALPVHAPAGVRRSAFASVRAATSLPRLEIAGRTNSRLDPFVKYTLRTEAGEIVEAVRIPLEREGRVSVCVSSQIGCGLGCTFCATGRLGFVRHLEAWEIVEQVRAIKGELPKGTRVHGVVFQGMGEPLLNFGEVVRAARVFSEPAALAIDARSITVCTSGLPDKIRELGHALPNVRLALSVGSAREEVRRTIMPVSRAHPLEEVLDAVSDHAAMTGHCPLFSYTVLPGVNDANEDAAALARVVHDFVRRCGVRPRLTLVDYNPIGGADPYRRATNAEQNAFWLALSEHGVRAKKRYSGGSDVGAACGQLAAEAARPC
jgi:23S rRNA (adenine2503-C2)-methyltransferase